MNFSLLMVTVKNLFTARTILVSVALVLILSMSLLLNLFLNKIQFLLIFASSSLSGVCCLATALHYVSKISWEVNLGK